MGSAVRGWLPLLTITLLVLVMAGLTVQTRAVLACFDASDRLGELLHRARDDERVMMLGERMAAAARLDDVPSAATVDTNAGMLAFGRQVHLDATDMALLATASDRLQTDGLLALRKAAAQDAEQARALGDARYGDLVAWRSWVFRSTLFNSNCILIIAVGAVVLSVLYSNERFTGRQRLTRAQRTILDTQRKQASFLTAAGHDLRQPLGALALFVSSLRTEKLDASTAAVVAKISAAAAAMERMIASLLDVAKLDAGLVAADLRPVPLKELLDSLRAEFELLAAKRGLRFTADDTGVVVMTDPDLLERILRNLVANAIKYTQQGEVAVEVKSLGTRVVLAVADTGPGMEQTRLGSIFQDFVRLPNAGSDGLGLGLGIVRRLADLLGTEVRVESALGAGSVFRLELPAAGNLNHTPI